jgi:predicted transcriptional regulator
VAGLQQVVSGGAVKSLVALAQPLSLVDGAPGPLPHGGFDPGMIFGQHRELVGE